MFLVFISWWGFGIWGILDSYKLIPDKWYYALFGFIASIAWSVIVRLLIEKKR